jgi:hypothetical protein
VLNNSRKQGYATRERLPVLLVLVVLLILSTPQFKLRGNGSSKLEIAFNVVDASTSRPVPEALIALYERGDLPPKLLRTDAAGTASMTTACSFSVHTTVYPLTGPRESKPRTVDVPERLIVISAREYQPPEPWWLSSYSDSSAEDRGKSFYLPVQVKLEPQTP